MRVVVCGAGIEGLTLAQALRDACDVTVVERDPDAVTTGGYRLAVNAPAAAVLTRVLHEDLMRRVRAASIEVSMRLTGRWHPWLPEQIARSDTDRVAAFPFRAADPRANLTPWSPEHITALGDAIHAMPPTGGQAASTAIRDAGCLSIQILDHVRTGCPCPRRCRATTTSFRDGQCLRFANRSVRCESSAPSATRSHRPSPGPP